MERLYPHIILRGADDGRADGRGPRRPLGLFCARTLFRGSDLSMNARAEEGGRRALRRQRGTLRHHREPRLHRPLLRRDAEPPHPPQLDGVVAELRADAALKIEAQHMKRAFTAKAETLLPWRPARGLHHGDGDGHAGHRPGVRLLRPDGLRHRHARRQLPAWPTFAQRRHIPDPAERAACQDWVLQTATETWEIFVEEFSRLWRTERTGILYARTLFEDQGDADASETALARGAGARSSRTCSASPASRCTAASSGSPICASLTASPTRTSARRSRSGACRLGRDLVLNRRRITGIGEVLDMARARERGTA